MGESYDTDFVRQMWIYLPVTIQQWDQNKFHTFEVVEFQEVVRPNELLLVGSTWEEMILHVYTLQNLLDTHV